MEARFHHRLVWIGATALVGIAACGGGGHEKATGTAPGKPGAPGGPAQTPTQACLTPAWFGSLDEAARARTIELVCADARSGTLAEKRLTGEAGPTCKGVYSVKSDEEVLAVMTALNDGQMRQANLGEANATPGPVRDYAHAVGSSHARVGEEQRAMMRRTRARAQDDELSRTLTKGFDESQTSLRAARGPNFDKEFMSREIIMHARSLEMLDELAPQTKGEEARCAVNKTRGVDQVHLQLACSVYHSMPAPTPTPPAPAPPSTVAPTPEPAPAPAPMPAPAPPATMMPVPADPPAIEVTTPAMPPQPAPMPTMMPAEPADPPDPPAPVTPPAAPTEKPAEDC
jgi:predicted outer membrane protein